MLVSGDSKYIQAPFESAEELEGVAAENYVYIFGPNSFYLSRNMINTSDGFGINPYSFAFDLAGEKWFIVEAEPIKQNVWSHIAPQVSKQNIASQQSVSRILFVSLTIETIKNHPEIFDELDIDKYKLSVVLYAILEKPPLIGLPVVSISDDLAAWARTLRIEDFGQYMAYQKNIEVGNPNNNYILLDEYKPLINTEEDSIAIEGETERKIKAYNISVHNLIKSGLITPVDELIINYKPRAGKERKELKAIVDEDGNFNIYGDKYPSPSYAALACLQDAGSDRKTVNGWTSWRTSQGKTLADLLQDYLILMKENNEQGASPDLYSTGAL